MKTLYIPKGEARTYESLTIDRVVVHGSLTVATGLGAKRITGRGIITAGTVSADVVTADEVETARITCKRLMAKRVYAAEVYASDSAVVSCSLTAAYVETGKLTTALSEIDEVKADEVVNLPPKRRGMLLTLIASALVSLWLAITTPREKKPEPEYSKAPETAEDPAAQEQGSQTVREIMEENGISAGDGDIGLKKLVSTYLLLRDQGYTLSVCPAAAQDDAPVLNFEQEKLSRTAA